MISLFHIPHHTIDTSRFSNLLHDKIVRDFEERFCEYVGAQYGCSLNSATSGIFLMFSAFRPQQDVCIPSIIPTVVPDAVLLSECTIRFVDNVDWVGDSYILHQLPPAGRVKEVRIIDSAQRVDRNQFKLQAKDEDLMFFSFYPTKPVGSCDGGMIVSNNKEAIEHLRSISFNGTTQAVNNWEREKISVGHKMYMNSIQAYIANKNLNRLDNKKERLAEIRTVYNSIFGYNNTSDHLYRINVRNNEDFIQQAADAGICCGIHYRAAHQLKVYHDEIGKFDLPLSDFQEKHSVSLPFHEKLSLRDMEKITEFTLRFINE